MSNFSRTKNLGNVLQEIQLGNSNEAMKHLRITKWLKAASQTIKMQCVVKENYGTKFLNKTTRKQSNFQPKFFSSLL